MKFLTILTTEILKLRRSWFLAGITIVTCIIPFALGLMMFIIKNPELSTKLGLLGEKAQLRGHVADWAGFISGWREMIGIASIVVLGLIVSWIFAREDAERCAKNLWGTGVPRAQVIAAKLTVASVIFIILTIIMTVISFGVGNWLDLSGWSTELALNAVVAGMATALAALLVAPITALVALRGRGYLAPLGFTIVTVLLATLFGMTGWGAWCPWTIVAFTSTICSPVSTAPGPASYVFLGLVAIGGIIAAIKAARADCHQ